MTVTVCYVAVTGGPKTSELCARFVSTWFLHPPEYPCDLIVACNGGPLPNEIGVMFTSLNAKLYPRPNDPGWDISAFCDVARNFESDFLVLFGESVYFHKAGWIKRLVEAREKFGPGMYGILSSNNVRAHLNTTAFAVDIALLRSWPKVTNGNERYQFEHGENSFWRRVQGLHKTVCLVTWDGEYAPMFWRTPRDIMWRGDQSNCLAFCVHTERFAAADVNTKATWAANADRPYR